MLGGEDVDFNKNVVNALNSYFDFVHDKKISITSKDFKKFFSDKKYSKNDFVYLDPPYLISASEYNKLWNKELESDLLKMIDVLDENGVKFALSNVTHYNGSKNDLLLEWMKKYKVHKIESNYINYHNNGKKIIKEVLITNY
jgi:DNA adenine methylase